jgi:ABC-type transport system involved in multi-copper enzyme maturation permease subunit
LLWKEIHADAPVGSHRFSALVMFLSMVFGWMLVAVLVVMLLLLLSVSYDSVLGPGLSQIHQTVRALGSLLGGFMLLLVPLYAAGSVIRERERQTMDALLTLPDGPAAVILAKWIGATQAVRPLWPCLLIIWGVGVVTGTLHVLAVPLLVLAWGIYALFFSALGLWFSVTQKTSVRAMLWALACLFALVYARNMLLTFGPTYPGEPQRFELHPLLSGVLPGWSIPGLVEWLRFGLLPWDGLWALSFDYRADDLPMRFRGAFIGLAIYAIGAAVLWGVSRWQFLRQTTRN